MPTSMRSTRLVPALLACGIAALLLALVASSAVAAGFGPFAPRNPFTAANGAATMHGDSESSDASPYPGPGTGAQVVVPNELAAACPTVLQGSDGMPVALCTSILGRNPVAYLLDPATGGTLASLSLPAGNLFAGVYAYIDQENRVVLFDANGNLDRIGHHYKAGHWTLSIDSSTPAATAIDQVCAELCGGVVGIAPDWQGNVWFATTDGVAGYVEPGGGVKTIALGSGEQVANSISTAPEGTAIATDHALYLLAAGDGGPKVLWRYAYDRGPARKPGQLSHGTGSTPTFFGPEDGTRYLAILDNASPAEHLLVFDTWKQSGRDRGHTPDRTSYKVASTPQVVCDLPVLTPGPSGSENSPVGSGRSVFVASTYGYPYPSVPEGAEPAEPETAPFTGGVERIDLTQGGGCTPRWQDDVRSAAVPRLDASEGVLYTVQDTDPTEPEGTGLADIYSEVAIDAATGEVLHSTTLGAGYLDNTLQLAPTIVPGRVMYQGTITGILRISPLEDSTPAIGTTDPASTVGYGQGDGGSGASSGSGRARGTRHQRRPDRLHRHRAHRRAHQARPRRVLPGGR
jgi:hypothetical protein